MGEKNQVFCQVSFHPDQTPDLIHYLASQVLMPAQQGRAQQKEQVVTGRERDDELHSLVLRALGLIFNHGLLGQCEHWTVVCK